ncbi:hypothetical protein M3912_003413 [Vibrio metschnikovii]|nr:hypothetical protein [Vibrio metschnikovii]
MSKSTMEIKRYQFDVLKNQFSIVLRKYFDDEKALEQAAIDAADTVLTSWSLKEELCSEWGEEWLTRD